MITIDVSDITRMITSEEIEKSVIADLQDTATAIFVNLTAPPPLGTPVDTGFARDSWEIDFSIPMAPEIFSMAVYMPRLNDGWSQQSPSLFIEAAVSKALTK